MKKEQKSKLFRNYVYVSLIMALLWLFGYIFDVIFIAVTSLSNVPKLIFSFILLLYYSFTTLKTFTYILYLVWSFYVLKKFKLRKFSPLTYILPYIQIYFLFAMILLGVGMFFISEIINYISRILGYLIIPLEIFLIIFPIYLIKKFKVKFSKTDKKEFISFSLKYLAIILGIFFIIETPLLLSMSSDRSWFPLKYSLYVIILAVIWYIIRNKPFYKE